MSMYVCMYACICVRMYVCMYVCMYMYVYVCVYVSMYVCVCMYVCMYVYTQYLFYYTLQDSDHPQVLAYVDELGRLSCCNTDGRIRSREDGSN